MKTEQNDTPDGFFEEIRTWQNRMFPDKTVQTTLDHLEEEVKELLEAPSDRFEIADCLLLLSCLATDQGYNPIQIMREKHKINVRREWRQVGNSMRHVK